MQIPHDGYVLVADGQKMLFFRNEGDEAHPNLEVVSAAEQQNAKSADQGSDEPGRSAAGVAARSIGITAKAGRSAFSETDFHKLEEERFAAEAAEMLKQRALSNEFESLLIVAPPTTLGELRRHYHAEVERRLIGEIPKDLTNHPVSEIEKVITQS
jgi:protein required for attachment to host cells